MPMCLIHLKLRRHTNKPQVNLTDKVNNCISDAKRKTNAIIFPSLFCVSEACLKENWAEKKGDPAVTQGKKKKKNKKKGKGGEHNQNREKKVKKKKSKHLDEHSDKQNVEEDGHTTSDDEIQRSVPLPQEKTEL